MSERQLHERITRAVVAGRKRFAVRSCGMEVRSEPQCRTKVKLRQGRSFWVSEPGFATPDIRSGAICIGDGDGGTSKRLTPGDLERSTGCTVTHAIGARVERPAKETTTALSRLEKSDHPVVASKPSNAGGAKGVTK